MSLLTLDEVKNVMNLPNTRFMRNMFFENAHVVQDLIEMPEFRP